MTREWVVWWREWFRYKVAICIYSNWAGSDYKYARNDNGRVLKFWTKAAAQKHADMLNLIGANQ